MFSKGVCPVLSKVIQGKMRTTFISLSDMQITGVIFSIISTVNRLPALPLYTAKIPLPENRQRDFLYVPIRQMWTHSRRTTPSAPTAATILQQSFKNSHAVPHGKP